MKLVDQHDQPITDPSILPPVEFIATTHGKNGVPALPVISEAEPESDPKISPRERMVARLRNIRDRLMAYAEQLGDRKAAVSALVATAQSLDLAIAGAATLPPDWQPVRTPANIERSADDHVVIRSKYRATYQDDLSAEDMDDLVVERVGEKRLRCRCPSGAIVFVPAGHVENK